VAEAARPWYTLHREGAAERRQNLSPLRGLSAIQNHGHGLQPWLRSNAAPRLLWINQISLLHRFSPAHFRISDVSPDVSGVGAARTAGTRTTDPNVWVSRWVIPTRTFAFRPEAEWVEEFVCDTNVDYNKLFKKD
jgi:hypothetical protein